MSRYFSMWMKQMFRYVSIWMKQMFRYVSVWMKQILLTGKQYISCLSNCRKFTNDRRANGSHRPPDIFFDSFYFKFDK